MCCAIIYSLGGILNIEGWSLWMGVNEMCDCFSFVLIDVFIMYYLFILWLSINFDLSVVLVHQNRNQNVYVLNLCQ